jgi:hypothetical protein
MAELPRQGQQGDRLKGADLARQALEVAGDDPGTLANAALALAYFGQLSSGAVAYSRGTSDKSASGPLWGRKSRSRGED